METHLFWYGDGAIIGQDLVVNVRLPPAGIRDEDWVLTVRLSGVKVVPGHMVVQTISDGEKLRVGSIAHDPDESNGGTWRGNLEGTWPCYVTKRERPSRFEREDVL